MEIMSKQKQPWVRYFIELIFIAGTYNHQHDDAEFYNKFDQEIYSFIENVKLQLASVSQERDILGKFLY